jgi:hypothetical protein
MKNSFFYLILSFSLLFFNCKKEENQPVSNRIVIVDRNGKTAILNPSITSIYNHHDGPGSSFNAKTSDGLLSIGMSFSMNFADTEVFDSTGVTNSGAIFGIGINGSEYWVATAGMANVSRTWGGVFSQRESGKITFNNVQFTRSGNNSSVSRGDTIWVSGILNFQNFGSGSNGVQ